jgi:hypothetical protein
MVEKMKARDIFGIVIRIFGVVLLLFGFWYLAFGVAQACGMPQETRGEMAAYFATGIPPYYSGSCFSAVPGR